MIDRNGRKVKVGELVNTPRGEGIVIEISPCDYDQVARVETRKGVTIFWGREIEITSPAIKKGGRE